jgi:hypothetical protein
VQCERHLNNDSRGDRLASTGCWPKRPLFEGLQSFFVKAGVEASRHANVGHRSDAVYKRPNVDASIHPSPHRIRSGAREDLLN